MKKLISLLLCAIMLLIPMTISVQGAEGEKFPMMGDINLDGKITASDARKVLRMSATLESSAGLSFLNYDADGNGKLSAADARLLLRKSAGLGELTYGFDANGVPNSIRAIKSENYVMSVAFDDMSFTVVKKGADSRILGADIGGELAQMGMADCGVMYCDNKLYMTYKNKGNDIAMYIPAELYDTMGISVDDIKNLADSISMFIPDELGTPERVEENGKVSYIYSAGEENAMSRIVTDAYGVITAIENYDENGNKIDTVFISSINAQVNASYFDLSQFELI